MTDKKFNEAKSLAYEGIFDKAYDILNKMMRDDEASCLYISVCRMLHKDTEAEQELTYLLSKNPNHARANHLRAMALIDSKNLTEAEAYLERAKQAYDDRQTNELSELYTDWGNLHYENKNTIQAVLSWRRALKLAPQNDMALKNLEEFDDIRFENAATVNEMVLMAEHPSQVLAHLMRHQEFKTQEEVKEFAEEIISLWNMTPRKELGDKSPLEAS